MHSKGISEGILEMFCELSRCVIEVSAASGRADFNAHLRCEFPRPHCRNRAMGEANP